MTAPDGARIIRAAQLYASNGWYVIPTKVGDKKPLVKWAEASRDAETVANLFDRKCNLAVMTGRLSGLVVIDIDPRHGGVESLARLQTVCPFPPTPTVRTGGGGQHFYFRWPVGAEIRTRPLPGYDGIDIKAQGGMCQAPPSLHASGNLYAWEPEARPDFAGGIPFAELTPELLEAIRDKPAKRTELVPVEDDVIVGGVRNATLFKLACDLRRRNYSANKIEAHLRLENGYCRPPLPEPEIVALAKSAARYQPDQITPDLKPENLRDPTRLEVITDEALRKLELTPLKEIVPGLLTEGITILAAKPKVGKSWLALQLAQAVALGGYALGTIKVEQGQSLYFALEDGRNRLQKRLATLDGYGDSLSSDQLHYVFEFDQSVRQAPKFLANEVLAPQVDAMPNLRLLIVDTMARFRPARTKGSDAYTDDYAMIQPFQDLAKARHIAIVFVHHLRKAVGDDVLDEVNSSMGLPGAADATLILKRPRGSNEGTIQLVGRDLPDASYAIRLDQTTCAWTIQGAAEDFELSETRKKILEYLDDQPGQQPIAVSKALLIPYGSCRQALARMLADGQVYQRDRRYYSSIQTDDAAARYTRHRAGCPNSQLGAPCDDCSKLFLEMQSAARRN